jgi:chemotaxis protein CheC
MILSELHADFLKEALNMGVGLAASALSELAGGEEILLSVPEVQILTIEALANEIANNAGERVTTVTEHFSGPFKGRAMMMYSQKESLELVKLMLHETIPVEQLSEMEAEALCEVGNIVLNACLSSLADLLGEPIESEIPFVEVGNIHELLQRPRDMPPPQKEDSVIYLKMQFSMAVHQLSGFIGFFLDLDAISVLVDKLDAFIKGQMGL